MFGASTLTILIKDNLSDNFVLLSNYDFAERFFVHNRKEIIDLIDLRLSSIIPEEDFGGGDE